jgi:hypothetical protein
MNENRREELECALYGAIGVSLSVWPYLGPRMNLFLSIVAGAYWVIARGQLGNPKRFVVSRRIANYVLFWAFASIGGGPMLLMLLNGRQVGVASLLLPFLIAGVSGMTAQTRDILQPWPEEVADIDIDVKTLENQLCLAYFQTSGGIVPTIFAGVLIFSIWMQWEWARRWDPQYVPVHETILALYGFAFYILGIVQPGLKRSRRIRREIMIYRSSLGRQLTPNTSAETISPSSPSAPLPSVFEHVAAAVMPAGPFSVAVTAPRHTAPKLGPPTNSSLDQLTQATTSEVPCSMPPRPSKTAETSALGLALDNQGSASEVRVENAIESAPELPPDEAERAGEDVNIRSKTQVVAEAREGTAKSPPPEAKVALPTGEENE